MLLFGHIGLTIGISKVFQDLITLKRPDFRKSHPYDEPTAIKENDDNLLNKIREKVKFTDYRLILLGCLLPDIIDKPMWLFTNNTLKWDGRGYSHTFMFTLVLLIIGLVLAVRWKKAWLLTISIGSVFHLIFDQMWLNPTALWWPLLGPIPREVIPEYFSYLWKDFLANPFTYISESVGLLVTLFIIISIIRGKKVMHFLKTGDLGFIFR